MNSHPGLGALQHMNSVHVLEADGRAVVLSTGGN